MSTVNLHSRKNNTFHRAGLFRRIWIVFGGACECEVQPQTHKARAFWLYPMDQFQTVLHLALCGGTWNGLWLCNNLGKISCLQVYAHKRISYRVVETLRWLDTLQSPGNLIKLWEVLDSVHWIESTTSVMDGVMALGYFHIKAIISCWMVLIIATGEQIGSCFLGVREKKTMVNLVLRHFRLTGQRTNLLQTLLHFCVIV